MTRGVLIAGSLGIALVLAMLASLAGGAVAVSPQTIWNTLFDLDGPQQAFIINRSRLPRTLLAALTGASLAVSGAIIQALLRNPLASPKIIGINSGAAFAVLVAAVVAPSAALFAVPVFAAMGGTFAAAAIYLLAETNHVSPARLALIGVAFGFTADAGVDFILVTADSYAISAPLVWLTGSLWGRGWDHLNIAAPILVPMAALSLCGAYRLDLFQLGTTQAQGLGVHVRSTRMVLLALATLLASVSVGMVGVLGFVGLMAPHIARMLVGGRHVALLPVALLIGALLVVLADAAGRALFPPIEISAGILTALFGAPFFIYLLITRRLEA